MNEKFEPKNRLRDFEPITTYDLDPVPKNRLTKYTSVTPEMDSVLKQKCQEYIEIERDEHAAMVLTELVTDLRALDLCKNPRKFIGFLDKQREVYQLNSTAEYIDRVGKNDN